MNKVIKNIKNFKYRGKRYIVAETIKDIKNFYGARKKIGDIQICIVNSFLPKDVKRRTIHGLIKNKKCRP